MEHKIKHRTCLYFRGGNYCTIKPNIFYEYFMHNDMAFALKS